MKARISLTFLALIFSTAVATSAFADAAKGEELFNDKGKAKCSACHKFGGKSMGPDLDGISQRANAEWLAKWLADAPATWEENDATTQALKTRLKREGKKIRHKTPELSPDMVADLVDFLMTK